MTEEKNVNKNAMLTIKSQYIKDLSFENPNAPASFMMAKITPDIQVALDLGAKNLENNASYEVVLHLKIEAKQEKSTMFLLELSYGTNVIIQDLDQNHI